MKAFFARRAGVLAVLATAIVAAGFAPANAEAYAVNTWIKGAGTVTGTGINCVSPLSTPTGSYGDPGGSGCTEDYGSAAFGHQITAIAPAGWTFTGWTSCPTPVANVCGFGGLFDTNTYTITANFADTTPPPIVLASSGPAGTVGSTSATFSFSSTDPVASFRCQLDTGVLTTCTSPRSYTGLTHGQHTFQVQARDPSGNVSSFQSRTWTVDTISPPTPTITGGPAASVASTLATFFYTNAEPGVSFQCSLDSTTAYATCPAGSKTYTSLAQGPHTFRVRAVDAVGNISGSAARSWTVDTVPPTTNIVSGPTGVVGSALATFAFSSNEAPVTYECSLDGTAFAPCTSTPTFAGLLSGPHTLRVRARDAAGNTDPSPADRSWTVDTIAPPVPTITGGPSALVRSTAASIAFSGSEPGALYECRLDDGAFAGCVSPASYTGLPQGPHVFEVRAKDGVGNVSLPATRAWTVDTRKPNTRITAKPKKTTFARKAAFRFVSEKGARFQCKLDRRAWAACKSPKAYGKLKVGKHTFRVRAKDRAGNIDASPAKYTWTIRRR